jgi:hypothetical protein
VQFMVNSKKSIVCFILLMKMGKNFYNYEVPDTRLLQTEWPLKVNL